MGLEKYKITDGNHLPSINDGRHRVYSKQFNELVDYIDTIDGGGVPGTGLYDVINEYSTNTGCTVDGVLLKDSNVDFNSDALATGQLIFDVDGDSYMTASADDVVDFYVGGTKTMVFNSTNVVLQDGINLNIGITAGSTIGGGSLAKIGFWGVTPVVQPTGLTANDAQAIDATYGVPEQEVLGNVRTRLLELETRLKDIGLLA